MGNIGTRFSKVRKSVTVSIYVLIFAYFCFQMGFYTLYASCTPDETAHISYVAYLTKTKAILPDLREMRMIQKVSDSPAAFNSFSAANGYAGTFSFGSAFNYLCHPPLYYQVMRLAGGVRMNADGTFRINLLRMRVFSMCLAALAILLLLYIGLTRIRGNPAFHLLYATVCISVPMLAFVSSGVNNDTMSLLMMSLLFYGLVRFQEKRRGISTLLLIALGFSGCLLTKETAGLMAGAMLLLYVIYLLILEHNLRFLLSKQFLVTVPLYLAGVSYYVYLRAAYGSFLPDFQGLSPAQFQQSEMYIQPAAREAMTLLQYLHYFASSFLSTWTGIFSHVMVLKADGALSVSQVALVLLPVLPLLLYGMLIRRRRAGSPGRKSASLAVLPMLMYPVVAGSVALQFERSYRQFVDTGHKAAWQSRYYLCTIGFLALAVVIVAQWLYGREPEGRARTLQKVRRCAVTAGCVLFCGLLIYEDFIYFVLHFHPYP